MRIQKERELTRFVNKTQGQPFVIGITDCHIIALEVIDIYKGTNYTEQTKGKYKSFKKGMRIAFELTGCSCFSEFLEQIATPIDASLIQAGDIAVDIRSGIDACLICLGRNQLLEACPKANLVQVKTYEPKVIESFRFFRL
ncbi:DUF6950 family protein [Shewanella frigidimarina]|uniref:DUF6950 family protein n=1 Tax=Shewanella frigidimarina TaxID=56812 RepID=UPI003D78CC12